MGAVVDNPPAVVYGGVMSSNGFVQFSVRVPEKMHAELVRLAGREFSSLNREATIAIRAHLDADKQRRARG